MPVAAMVGDIVRSRRHVDQVSLFDTLGRVLADRVDDHGLLEPPHSTIGDEFQAVYTSVDAALAGAVLIRAGLADATSGERDVRVRIGIGWGEIVGGDNAPQSGTAWWNARSAVEHVESVLEPGGWTWVDGGSSAHRAVALLLDTVTASWDVIDHRILLYRDLGRRQAEIGSLVGMDQSSVSKRISRHSISTVLSSLEELRS